MGPQVAEKLHLPQVTYAEEILEVKEHSLIVKRHIDIGVETVEVPMPCLITVNGSAAPCRPRNARLTMIHKHDEAPHTWSVADIDGDVQQCGLSGSPTKVKAIQNIIFQAKEAKTLTSSNEDIQQLITELKAEKII